MIRNKILFIGMAVGLLILMIFATAVGAVYVPFFDTVSAILKNWGLGNIGVLPEHESVIYFIRLPRVVVAALVGAALAVSGAVMQGMFGNPLADPGIIGVSSGAALGAVLAIALGLTYNMYIMPAFAAVGALVAVGITVMMASRNGKVPLLVLLLAGIAVSMFLSACTAGVLSVINEHQVREYLFWMVGGLDYRRWEHVQLIILPVIVGIGSLCAMAPELNILAMGEETAHSVGVNLVKTRRILLAIASLTTAMAVCVSGNIGFVGLIVPHILRLVVGPDHRLLLPASALGGAIFLVGCDLISRLIISPAEIRVGIVTALVGSPYFLYLLSKAKRGAL